MRAEVPYQLRSMTRSSFLSSFVLMASLTLPACVIVNGDDGSGSGSGNDSANDDGATSSSQATDDGNGPGGDGGVCDDTDPGGMSCEEAADCTVVCNCPDGGVNVGVCINNACQAAADTCSETCSDYDGYCFIGGGSSGDDGADGTDGGGVCANTGETCTVNGDCCGFDSEETICVNAGDFSVCADTCTDDTDCESLCCAPLEGGGGACAPAEFC